MPNTIQHLEKVRNNKLVLDHLGDTDQTRFPEWYITVSFYIAVHCIEAILCKECRLHAKTHERRYEYLTKRHRKMDAEVVRAYDALQIQSEQARYEPYINDEEMQKKYCKDAASNLSIIETECKESYFPNYPNP